MSHSHVRFLTQVALGLLPLLCAACGAGPEGQPPAPQQTGSDGSLEIVPTPDASDPADETEVPVTDGGDVPSGEPFAEGDGGAKKGKPWSIDGGIDPTNAPVLAGDFLSLTASIAPREAALLGADAPGDGATGAGLVVAILDSGFNLAHPAVSGRWTPERYDAVSRDDDPTDGGNGIDDDGDGVVDLGVGHGTFVASLVARMAPGARLMPIRIADDEGNGSEDSFDAGIKYAIHRGAHVINVSFELDAKHPAVMARLRDAERSGIVVVCAAGNEGSQTIAPLGSATSTLTVGAVDDSDVLATWSNFGPAVALYAPGVDVIGAFGRSSTPGRVAIWSGTSFAAAFVSGAAALALERHPGWSPFDVRAALTSSVRPAFDASGAPLGGGRLDLLLLAQK